MPVTNITTVGAGGGGGSVAGSSSVVYTIGGTGTGGTFTLPHGTGNSGTVLTSNGWGPKGHTAIPNVSLGNVVRVEDDILITKKGKTLKVFDVLEMLMERMGIIIADDEMLDKSPALKAAYEHYVSVFKDPVIDPKVKEAYDSYHVILKLSREENV